MLNHLLIHYFSFQDDFFFPAHVNNYHSVLIVKCFLFISHKQDEFWTVAPSLRSEGVVTFLSFVPTNNENLQKEFYCFCLLIFIFLFHIETDKTIFYTAAHSLTARSPHGRETRIQFQWSGQPCQLPHVFPAMRESKKQAGSGVPEISTWHSVQPCSSLQMILKFFIFS